MLAASPERRPVSAAIRHQVLLEPSDRFAGLVEHTVLGTRLETLIRLEREIGCYWIRRRER
jgi:hypothetical protein